MGGSKLRNLQERAGSCRVQAIRGAGSVDPGLKPRSTDADASIDRIPRRSDDVGAPAHQPNIDKCNACGKLFPRVSIRLCTKCAIVEEHRFELVKEFLQEHEGAAVGEVSRATGVSASDVQYFMERGRLISLENVCTCGGIGERCRFCRSKLSNGFKEMQAAMLREQASRKVGEPDAPERTTYVRRIRRVGET
jgi:hypothetical protein